MRFITAERMLATYCMEWDQNTVAYIADPNECMLKPIILTEYVRVSDNHKWTVSYLHTRSDFKQVRKGHCRTTLIALNWI